MKNLPYETGQTLIPQHMTNKIHSPDNTYQRYI
jgi:hypothetical protein